MKFGVREICDVVLKAKAAQKVGNKLFYKNEPVIYFDTLKTSTMEGAATTVYAQGGRGNSRLVAWEGERTITFTMEDALISPAGFMILSGAGLISAGEKDVYGNEKTLKIHTTEQTDYVVASPKEGAGAYGTETYDVDSVIVTVESKPFEGDKSEDLIYVMLLENGEVITEPYIPSEVRERIISGEGEDAVKVYDLILKDTDDLAKFRPSTESNRANVVLVDYYVEKAEGAQQIEITPDKFGGNYYLEASTLFRDTNGVDMPAEFIIPNCKIQSNFTFSMASSGDPSTFTFTMDAFPDYTRFDKTKKVLAAIQIVDVAGSRDLTRDRTASAQRHLFE